MIDETNCRECVHCPEPEDVPEMVHIPSVCEHFLEQDGGCGCNHYMPKKCSKASTLYFGKCGIPECKICYSEKPEKTLGEMAREEIDRFGYTQESAGKKYDTGKSRIGEMIIDFAFSLKHICKVWEFGANKYEKSNWKKVENAKDRYTNAMIRHLLAEETEVCDKETELHHCLHVAWNAIARVYFILKETKSE